MGKKLIIKGADFSENAIIVPQEEMNLEKYGIDLTDVPGFGLNNNGGDNRMRAISNIFIPRGASIKIEGLKGLSGQETALRMDFCYYTSNSRSSSTVVGSYSNKVVSDYYTLNMNGDDRIIITNTYGDDYWFGFCMKKADDSNIDVSLYTPLVYSIP